MIQSNHGKILGAYTPIMWVIAEGVDKKMKDGHRSFVYFFDNKKLRMCRPRND